MKCPRCETTTLDEKDREGVVVDIGTQCRGMWLDRGELEKLIARATRDLEEIAQQQQQPAARPQQQQREYPPPEPQRSENYYPPPGTSGTPTPTTTTTGTRATDTSARRVSSSRWATSSIGWYTDVRSECA